MARILSAAMDKAANDMANAIEPLMRDTFMRVSTLHYHYDMGKWEAIIAALTEKMPARLKSLPISKDDRLEMLTLLDILDRTLREKGPKETLETLLMSLVAMFDVFDRVRQTLNLRITDDQGNDVTSDIFGE